MELSIIVPVYNMAADGKLEYCLNSLVNQTITDFEIIAVDDESIALEGLVGWSNSSKAFFNSINLVIEP